MAFRGFSSDEEGSIVFDGEQFIINNPDNVPDDFDPGVIPVIGIRGDRSEPSAKSAARHLPPDPVTGL